MKIIGIDPGKNGGIAVLDISDQNKVEVFKMPETAKDILDLLKKISEKDVCMAFLEQVGGMPKMGGVQMFNFGQVYGWVETSLLACDVSTRFLRPQLWTKYYQLGTKSQCANGTEWKNKLKSKAQFLFPKIKVALWNSDALLIMNYGKENCNVS